ncbi:MAG: hypothetical protein ACR2MN_01000 [Acidimicrobiales bacterium]
MEQPKADLGSCATLAAGGPAGHLHAIEHGTRACSLTVNGAVPRTHHLTVSEITRLTDDTVAVTLRVPAELSDTFAFNAGQHITVAAKHAGVEGRRTIRCAQAR